MQLCNAPLTLLQETTLWQVSTVRVCYDSWRGTSWESYSGWLDVAGQSEMRESPFIVSASPGWIPHQESEGPHEKMSQIWERTWQSKCFRSSESRNLVKVKSWKNTQVCWYSSWKGGLCHPEGWGRQRMSPEHDSLGTVLISAVEALLKPVQQTGLYAHLWSSVLHALWEQYSSWPAAMKPAVEDDGAALIHSKERSSPATAKKCNSESNF